MGFVLSEVGVDRYRDQEPTALTLEDMGLGLRVKDFRGHDRSRILTYERS